uniref:Uncharacterized protein n=1 Tax=Candidatus Kentrum sp. UNK TaxID=2126344 RepID=A0A451B082_9GAMM|nr:MAG: hypothetical protein BECKUNK1418G_GA0071005_107716 [Candidatus Kentron sp. UNK]VFK71697.1 MAG: hypothetical protein BECKUNK1418H_GA0071006_10792 [Candidatus Kentron sp. UNK]
MWGSGKWHRSAIEIRISRGSSEHRGQTQPHRGGISTGFEWESFESCQDRSFFSRSLGPPGRFLSVLLKTKRPNSTQPFMPGSHTRPCTRRQIPFASFGQPQPAIVISPLYFPIHDQLSSCRDFCSGSESSANSFSSDSRAWIAALISSSWDFLLSA